jgi:hypothetical protein
MFRWLPICIFLLSFSVVVLAPMTVLAQGLVPSCPVGEAGCAVAYHPDNYGACELVQLSNNIVRFIIGLIAVVGAIIMVYAGYLLVTSRGNVSQMQRAKEMFTNILIGIVIMLSAFLVVNTVMSILVGSNASLVNWNNIDCGYAREAGTADATFDPIGQFVNGLYLQDDWVVVGGSTGRYSYTGGSGGGTGGGSCEVVADPGNACHPNNLSCFGDTQSASRVCNLESSGGQVRAVSGTDVCRDGHSFSGGLFQVNVLAHYDVIPGCSAGFFTKTGSDTQGNCLRRTVNSNGVEYCAVRDCSITNTAVYNQCMGAIMNPETNLQIACRLYGDRGWDPWITSARACGVR